MLKAWSYRFDALDFCKSSINIGLNVWAHHLENFIEEQVTVINCLVGKGVSSLKHLLVDFNSNLSFMSEQLHDLMGKYGRLPSFQKLLLTNVSYCVGIFNFAMSICSLRNLVFNSRRQGSPIARPSNLVGVSCNEIIIDLVLCFKHVNGIDVSYIVDIARINLTCSWNIE